MNELRNAIADVLELASSMIDDLDDQTLSALAELITAATERLNQMEQQPEDAPSTPPEDGLTQAMPSSNVEGFSYDDQTGKLLVRFLGDYPNREGPIYAYGGVPKQIFNLFQQGAIPARTDGKNRWGKWWKGKVPSMGASLYTLIKNGGYPYQKLT